MFLFYVLCFVRNMPQGERRRGEGNIIFISLEETMDKEEFIKISEKGKRESSLYLSHSGKGFYKRGENDKTRGLVGE